MAAQSPQGALVLLDDLANAVDLTTDFSGLSEVAGAKTILGALQLGVALSIRRTDALTVQDALRFIELWGVAENTLREAAQADPNDGLARAFLFRIYRTRRDRDGIDQILAEFLSADRRPVGGLSLYAETIVLRHMGNESDVLAFGRAHANSMPPASFGLIPDVHITCARQGATIEPYFLGRDEIRAEIVAAHEDFVAAPEPEDFDAKYAHSAFSFAFFVLQDVARFRYHTERLGDYRGGHFSAIERPSPPTQHN
ncbi:MAG: hypothetical protein R3C16_04055 [Hyphomonadaceae bacterium]